MEWFWNAVMVWLGWTFAPVIFAIGLLVLLGVVGVFFTAASKIENAIRRVKLKFKK